MDTSPNLAEICARYGVRPLDELLRLLSERQRSSFSILEFCTRNNISLGTYHKLKRAGLGPAEMRLGNVVRVTSQAEREWQAARTTPTEGIEVEAREASENEAKTRAKKAGKLSAASPRHVSKRKRGTA
jgi:hypothetical protein